ncbi:MAG TPA: VWA domain-containing protein, partial [Gemmataceae bacterium]|nr:VWA domain-containing protein [Gemmataceae bacterium]
MTRLLALLTDYWLVIALAMVAAVAVARVGLGGKPRLIWPAIAILLIGGHFLFANIRVSDLRPWELAGWAALAVAGVFVLALAYLVLTGIWSRHVALVLAALLAVTVGGLVGAAQTGAVSVVRSLRTLEFVQPWWLLLLLVIPLLVWFSYESLAGLGPIRRWVALSVRCLLVSLLALALAEPRLRRPNENICVLYVLDRSLSVPQEMDSTSAEADRDRRWLRLQQFVNSAVLQRGTGHRNDLSGAILFARRPRLVLPPSPVDKLIVTDALAGAMDPNYTDIAAAIKLAMASFPEGTGKRVILFSDGNENLGNADEQANLARQNGVQIDVVPLAEGYRHQNEVLVQAVEAPAQTAKGTRLPVRVLVRNAHPSRIVYGKLELLQNREGKERPIAMVGRGENDESPYTVRLVPGLNTFTFRDKAEGGKPGEDELSYSYRAVFTPLESRDANERDPQPGLAGDRIQNNKGMAHVIARGARRVLFVEPDLDDDNTYPHQHLIDQLRAARFVVLPRTVGQLPQNRDELTVYLSNFDCLVIGDVPAERFTQGQQEAVRSNTYDQGCGLVWVGGPDSYGAGGYQKTPIEAALPVDCEIKAMKAAGKGGLVLIMHASEMADGNKWQKEIAKLAIERLNAIDMVGVLYYDGSTRWHVPFQTVGEDKNRLKALVDKMVPGDMMDFDPFLKAAHDTLTDDKHGLAVKHTIVISDGDPQLNAVGRRALADMQKAGVTCSAVGVATHSAAEDKKMTEMAEGAAKGGRYYSVKNPNDLPAIYMRESR